MSLLSEINGRTKEELKIRKKVVVKKEYIKAIKEVEKMDINMGAFFDFVFDKVGLIKIVNELKKEVGQKQKNTNNINKNIE